MKYLSLILSIAALALALCQPLNVNGASLLVATLAVLVTALIGFQIFNIFSFEERIKQIRKEYQTFTRKSIEELSNYRNVSRDIDYCHSIIDLNGIDDAIKGAIRTIDVIPSTGVFADAAVEELLELCTTLAQEKPQELTDGIAASYRFLKMRLEWLSASFPKHDRDIRQVLSELP